MAACRGAIPGLRFPTCPWLPRSKRAIVARRTVGAVPDETN